MSMDQTIVLRKSGESLTDYWIRLFEHKDEYNLSCVQIADLLNEAYGVTYTESRWRKNYRLFEAGRQYERQRLEGGVATRILCLSDLHVPFQLPVSTFRQYAGQIDVLVLNGDIGDCQAISKFPKAYRISPMEELIETRQYLLELIVELAPSKVIVTYGNHDMRFQNYLAKSLDSDILELMPQTSLELLFVDGFNHYNKRYQTKSYYPPLADVLIDVLGDIEIEYTNNWWTQIGDTIICHPIAFSSGMMQTAKKAKEYFQDLGLCPAQIILGHTHKVGMYRLGNVMMYEQGCCCDVTKLHYGDGRLTSPQQMGYICFGQDINGHTVPSSVNLVSLN